MPYKKNVKEPAKAPSKEKKIDQIMEQLEDGLQDLFDSDSYKNWMQMCSKLHSYSLNNTILIAMQAGRIEGFTGILQGYQGWQKNFNRQVVKGSKGITILAPSPYKRKVMQDVVDPVTNKPVIGADGKNKQEEVEIKVNAFRPVTIFDACQTEGDPLPQLGVDELKISVDNYDDFIAVLMDIAPVPVEFSNIEGGAKGYFSPSEQKIVIHEGMPEAQTIKTFVHEICHSLVDDKDHVRIEGLNLENRSKQDKEVTAESCAFIVLNAMGIDCSDYSMGYIAGYSSGKDLKELKESLDIIKKTSDLLIDKLEDGLAERAKERNAELGNQSKDNKPSIKKRLKDKQIAVTKVPKKDAIIQSKTKELAL